jgi:3-oxoacyl-[acyl-carrier protein] reductase
MDFGQEFNGKRVVITGACGVIGRWMAQGFAKAGAQLCLTDQDPSGLQQFASELELGEGGFAQPADLADEASIDALVAGIERRWRAPDILVNNAGIYPSGFLLDIEVAEWDRIFDVNLRAPFILTRAIARLMIREGRHGSVVNISSGASRKMRRTVVPYCVSKTALDRLTKGFAIELAEFGIRVNAVEPGFAAGSRVSAITDEHVAATVSAIPLGRPSSPQDAVQAVLYLCSEAAAYVTGATLTVDGGNSIGSLAVHQAKKTPL